MDDDADSPAPATAPAPKLDELMLAMDVVDTIRHQETVVARELGREERDGELKKRLREIYQSQGLEVTDRILNQGIEALRESRFVYSPKGGAFPRFLALLWIRRRMAGIGLAVALAIIVALTGWSAWQRGVAERTAEAARIELTQTLPNALESAGKAALDEAKEAAATVRAQQLIADGEAALARQDAPAARQAIADLGALKAALLRTYELRIVSRPGEQTGVFRVPDVNTAARNYYLIVEAIGPDGKTVDLPIQSEEDGTTASVSKFGVRVPKATYDAVAADKQADGIVDDNRLGEKQRGNLSETYLMDVEDGRIRAW